MSAYGNLICPICMVSELTAATKVYPLCQCKLSICFDCLRRWAETKYCCPFCNIPFTQIALQQTEQELRVRLLEQVDTGKLEEVVSAWAELLRHLRTEMEVGLTVLNIDALGDDDGFYDLVWQPLQRSRTPFFPSNWGETSSISSMYSNIHNTHLLPPSLLSNASSMLIVQPSLSLSFTQPSNIPHGYLTPPQTSTNMNNEELPEGFSNETENLNDEPSSNVNEKLRNIHSSNGQPLGTDLRTFLSSPGNKVLLQDISSPPLDKYGSVRTGDLNLPPTPNSWVRPNSLRNLPHQSAGNLSTNSTSSIVEELIHKNGTQVKLILSKQLNVRWLVSLRPGTPSARKYGSNTVGVIMKHVKERVLVEGLERSAEMSLTVRLLDGSWLTKVPVDDLCSKGRRASLTEWLRIGDLLWTRFGIGMAKELHPKLGRVTVQFLGRFTDPWESSSRNRHVIYEELRSVLHNSHTVSRCSQVDEQKGDKRSDKEAINRDHWWHGQIVSAPPSGPNIKYTVIPMLCKTDTDISRRDAEEEILSLDSDDINLPPLSFGKTERESVPFQPHSLEENMDGEGMILENEWTKTKHTVTPIPPKTTACIERKYPGEDRSPGLDNGDVHLPFPNLCRTEKPSVIFCQATPRQEIMEESTVSEKDVKRIVGRPPSGTKVKHTANAMLSKMNTDISIETEQEGLLVLDSSVINPDPSITARAKRQRLLLQPAAFMLESKTSSEDEIEEPVTMKSPLNITGLTSSSGSFVLPGREPSHGKAEERQSYIVESDVPEFDLPTVGEDKSTLRIIYDTDIKTVLSAQDLIARIEKRAERLEIIRTTENAEQMSITM